MDKSLRKYAEAYETEEGLALALLSEGAQLIEKLLFAEGETLSVIQIIPDNLPDNGYYISWEPSKMCSEDNKETNDEGLV